MSNASHWWSQILLLYPSLGSIDFNFQGLEYKNEAYKVAAMAQSVNPPYLNLCNPGLFILVKNVVEITDEVSFI
jgi:hypothetical protein